MKQYDLVIQLGSQVQFIDGRYVLAPHTRMRTEASALVLRRGIAPRLIISGGSNFGVRYDDHELLKPAVFSFGAFAHADFLRKSEAAAIKDVLLIEFGLTSPQIFAETLSATTDENAAFLSIILKRRPMFTGNETIAILTLLYHMDKALPAFRKAGLNVEPLFAENVLAAHHEFGQDQVNKICEYYNTPKGGKQYDTARIRRLLNDGNSLEEMILPYWYITVINNNVCADGEPEELKKYSTYFVQARNKEEAAVKLCSEHKWEGDNLKNYIKGPFDTLEQAQKT